MKPLRTSWPSWHLLGGFPYSSHTDLAETFRKEWERLEAAKPPTYEVEELETDEPAA